MHGRKESRIGAIFGENKCAYQGVIVGRCGNVVARGGK